MAETIVKGSTSEIPVVIIEDLKRRPGTNLISVHRAGIVDTDAAPSDTTLYVVPEGRTLILTAVSFAKESTGGAMIPMYDKGDNLAQGLPKASAYATDPDVIGITRTVFPTGIIFTKGITIDDTDLTANMDLAFVIEGYVV